MSVVAISGENFEKEVLRSDVPVLVDFYADWCRPCTMMGPVVEAVAKDYADRLKVCKLDIERAQDIAVRFGVMSIPVMMLFKSGQKVAELVGALPKEHLQQFVNRHLK